MFARTLGLAVVGLTLCALGIQAGGVIKDKDVPKDVKDKDAAKDKKFEIPMDAVAGTVKAVNLNAPNFTVTLMNGNDKTFTVTKNTQFWGPKGGDRGTGPDGLKDDCMAKGYVIKVLATKDNKNAKDVYLPNRKNEAAKDKK